MELVKEIRESDVGLRCGTGGSRRKTSEQLGKQNRAFTRKKGRKKLSGNDPEFSRKSDFFSYHGLFKSQRNLRIILEIFS